MIGEELVETGSDSTVNVLDLNCRTQDIDNLDVVDSSFFPSIGAMNPTLIILKTALLCSRTSPSFILNLSLDRKAMVQ